MAVFGSPGFWQALNGRYISELIERYGFYTPCIGCHLICNSARIPLAALLGNKPIISGERESHNGGEKINQISEVLDAYDSIYTKLNIPLLLPIRHIADGKRGLKKSLKWIGNRVENSWDVYCQGNYRNINGKNTIHKKDALKFLDKFALPYTEKIIKCYFGR